LGNHAIVIAGHPVNQPAGRRQRLTRDSKSAESFPHAGRIRKLEGNDPVGMGSRLHCGLGLIVKAPDHGIARRECGE